MAEQGDDLPWLHFFDDDGMIHAVATGRAAAGMSRDPRHSADGDTN